jgi:hypothetical protein
VKKLSKVDKISAEIRGDVAMRKIGKTYNPIKNLSHWAHPKGASKPAGLAKTVKARIKTTKAKKGY